ncbi:MAG: hypothetical protein WCF57_09235, partial [Pyrinomonadaceae bacterium]
MRVVNVDSSASRRGGVVSSIFRRRALLYFVVVTLLLVTVIITGIAIGSTSVAPGAVVRVLLSRLLPAGWVDTSG